MKPKKDIIIVDVETTGLDHKRNRLHGLGVATKENVIYLPANQVRADLLTAKNIVGHNVRFDLKFLKHNPVEGQKIWDTRIMASLINENEPLGLKYLAQKYLGQDSVENFSELDETVRRLKMKSVADLCAKDLDEGGFFELIGRYCKEDCQNTLALFYLLGDKLKKLAEAQSKAGFKQTALDYFVKEAMPLEKVLLKVENRGIKVDVDKLIKFREALLEQNQGYIDQMEELVSSELREAEDELYQVQVSKRKSERGKAAVKKDIKRFNWQSNDHVANLIYLKLGVPKSLTQTTKTGKFNTSEKQLKSLQVQTKNERLQNLLHLYLKWKKNLKLLTTYTGENKGLLAHVYQGRIFAEYLQTGRGKEGLSGGTVTGRLSSRSPNMQNLPRGGEIKEFFIPDSNEHVFLYFDYSQLELRLAAHLSQDEKLMQVYTNGEDLHQKTADSLGIERQFGKTINFAMIYNASKWRLHAELKDKFSLEDCEELINEFFKTYNGYAAYLEKQKEEMIQRGAVVSETGRVRRLPALKTPPAREWSPEGKAFRHALNQGYNFPIQCLGASITKRAMIALDAEGHDIVTQVHDSVTLQVLKVDVPKLVGPVQDLAESVYPLTVPLKADVKVLNSLNESDVYKGEDSNATDHKEHRKLKVVSGGNTGNG